MSEQKPQAMWNRNRTKMMREGWIQHGIFLYAPSGVTRYTPASKNDSERYRKIILTPELIKAGWRLASQGGMPLCLISPSERSAKILARKESVSRVAS